MTNSSKAFLVVLLLMVGGGYYAFQQWNAGGIGLGELAEGPVTVIVPEGAGARDVAAILEEQGVVRSAAAFTAAATLDGRAGQIRAGTYELDPQWSTEELLDVLAAGPPAVATFMVTIPEGLTVTQTLERIAGAEGSPFTVDDLRAGLGQVALPAWVPQRELPEGAEPFEGMLFPETYEFTVEQTAAEVLTRLVTQTDQVIAEIPAATRNDLSTYEVLVLGSLIEREARLAEERATISSVIHNRITDGMALQIDATVVYGIEVATGERPSGLVNADYQFDTPWSTYVYPGLPPTPISGVGRASLEAAAAPADTDFYFYVVEDEATGAHRFSTTLDEHNAAIAEIRGG
jgi:UPF0755 protein